MIDQNVARVNAKRIDWKYRIGDKVLKMQHKPDKLDERYWTIHDYLSLPEWYSHHRQGQWYHTHLE